VTGNTPVMYAAMENKINMMGRMLDFGCEIHAKNKERYTTLHLASMYSREDTIKMLLARKADPTVPGGVREIIKCLQKGSVGRTLLSLSAQEPVLRSPGLLETHLAGVADLEGAHGRGAKNG
jgi:ankyrin repeat protein